MSQTEKLLQEVNSLRPKVERLEKENTTLKAANDEIMKVNESLIKQKGEHIIEINELKTNKEELEAALKLLTELYEKNVAAKGHEYEVSNMVDRSLSFLEKKVDRADVLLKNPHRIFFIKSKKTKEVKA